MTDSREAASWLGPPESMLPDWRPTRGVMSAGFVRLWRGFMAVRIFTGIVLLLLQAVILALGQPVPLWLLMLGAGYFLSAVLLRMRNRPSLPLRTLDLNWLLTVGADVAYFSVLLWEQTGSINYTPLFALPVLLASILGTRQLALATAAVAAMVLLADAWWISLLLTNEAPSRFLQAGLTGIGLFIVALLANQLASRLAREEQRAVESVRAERMQALVNELVIDNITDGVLVVDSQDLVRAANPAARQLLGAREDVARTPFSLRRTPAWHQLADLALITFEERRSHEADIGIEPPDAAPIRLHVRTRLTASLGQDESLCVFFMQDLREIEARIRTEKLAAMGRMSAAVAHEIRNPLAAIVQANALLEEDLQDPALRRFTQMVEQNAQRLSRIVEDVLDVARAQNPRYIAPRVTLRLDAAARLYAGEWTAQTGHAARVQLTLQAGGAEVAFEPDHLRRLLVNLLDNAARYASERPDAIQVATHAPAGGAATLRIWSDGAPLEQAVERHLFEPFFSSESRSSGLGLHICRELCERHGATIGYARSRRLHGSDPTPGNEFFIVFRAADAFATIAA